MENSQSSSTIIPVPSKNEVHKAGKILKRTDASPEDVRKALATLSAWRSLHYYPINTFQSYLQAKVRKSDYDSPIIAQRLKRLPSIVGKLQRFPSMGLETMQDIGGIRIVLDSVSEVYNFYEGLRRARFPHKAVLPPHDYIENPKPDGYRSLHQVYKYASVMHPELNGLHLELQLRTKLQHSWATAVETLGIVEKSSFKTGQGMKTSSDSLSFPAPFFLWQKKRLFLQPTVIVPHRRLFRNFVSWNPPCRLPPNSRGLPLPQSRLKKARTTFPAFT